MAAADNSEIVIYSDVDIIFCRDFSAEIYSLMNSGKDILFQSEHFYSQNMCSGFMVMRKSIRLTGLLDNVIKNIKKEGTGDQYMFNKFKCT